MQEQVDSKMLGSQEDSVEKNFSSEKQSKEFRRKENQIQNKSSQVEPKVEDYTNSNPKYHFMYESKAFGYHRDVKPKIAEDLRSMGHSAQTFVQVKEEAECCREVIDLECGVQPDLGYCEVSSVTNCDEAPETSFVQETSGMINGISVASPCSCSMNESSSPATVGLRSPGSPDQLLKQHISTPNFRKSPLGTESSVVATSERYSFGGTRSLTLEAESSFNMSVNSQALKRRKFTSSPVIDLEVENSDAPRPSTRPSDHTSLTRRIEFGFTEPRSQNYNIYSFPEVNQKVQLSCSLCRSPLGLPENHSYVNCLLTSSSKKYLLSLLKKTSRTGAAEMSTSVSIIMTDCSMVNQRLCRKFEGLKGQGIWCEQDGCVFNTIYCPFCSIPNTCLGVQVMATDSSNVQFLSKILFFADHLEVTNEAASKDSTLKHKEPLAETNAAVDKSDVLKSIDRFAYSPNQQQESGGWRTTKSKLRLPKRNLPTSKKA
ncbi:hypothetical protein AXX17_AT1G21730 [Arabidopsis thaliana]|uniref:Uncharacterized protein n=1 Tax=Arabidopsis thaliana TaxID=3702 RepID=A0A178WG75_ARATH|nr:hypothetical protein AXX17_AT1G21730 [Arabidopsis thaliana]